METTLANLLIQANTEISFSALKPYTGHLLGASGLSEFALTLICAQKGWVPPIRNNKATNITLPTQFVRKPKGCQKQITYFITLSYGLGSTIGIILGKTA
jgi:3-oxoacyl-(acyl-carrier-protein) synthase